MSDIVLEVPDSCERLASTLQIRLSFVDHLADAGRSDEPLAYADVEHALAAAAARVQLDAHRVVLESMARNDPRLSVNGIPHRFLLGCDSHPARERRRCTGLPEESDGWRSA